MAVRYKDGKPIPTKYHEPITIVKYIHDVVVVETWFGTFVLSPTSIAYVENEVSTLLEILAPIRGLGSSSCFKLLEFQPFLRF